jgi:hypothetical protein
MNRLARLTAMALLALTFGASGGMAHAGRDGLHRAYVHGYVDGYARAQKEFYAHARNHVRRKVVRLQPGRSGYRGQIDPFYRDHRHW